MCKDAATQCLPPGGRCPRKGADEERRYVPNLYAFREKGTLGKVVPFEWTALRMVRCRHSSSTASRSPFPPGEGIARHSSLQTPIFRRPNISKSSPEGIPHLISHILYLISFFRAPSASKGRPCASRETILFEPNGSPRHVIFVTKDLHIPCCEGEWKMLKLLRYFLTRVGS